ncbi:MAG: hypothetical protein ACXWJO_08620, partial [Xanthobacteraceae bacterium]
MSTTTGNAETRGPAAFNAAPNLGAALARNWWLIALRGVLGVMFGLLALILPFATILALFCCFPPTCWWTACLRSTRPFEPRAARELGFPGISGCRQHRYGGSCFSLARAHCLRLRAAHRRLVDRHGL